ncbi:cytochrome oxidase assembly protein ShyY1 [Microbacterium sp. AK009]|uniref:SURF1 family cytochrome oxidase biogenesis protein n=1 Tax=Microbacterium sp. AK009 TaxID=2723068 RepID=UPI0015CAA5A7|nr:SURF1 family protein [Microbacterium sp. AK009]NYF16229.1 cytochrome oxidase assembly protein ShyY1 [Microbacterium sp. AK009]
MTATRSSPLVRWTGYALVAVLFAIACAFLSNWQFSRNAERSEELRVVEQNYDATPVPLSEIVPAGSALDPDDEWRPVALVGQYLRDEQLLVRNRPHGGTAAFEVLVPFRMEDGRVVLINRGWVPPGADQAEPDAVPAPPEGTVTVEARLRPEEAAPRSGRSAPEGQVPTINIGLVAERLPTDTANALQPSLYALMSSEDPAISPAPSPLEVPSEDPGPHLSYAIQWILFAIMGFIFIGYIIRTELRHRREDREDDGTEASPADVDGPSPVIAEPRGTPRARRGRRRDLDASEEDALLDAAGSDRRA